MRRAVAGGCALGLSTGWNVANVGAIASDTARAYGVGLAVVGVFTTAFFATHLAMQIPGGRATDRFGARRTGFVGLAIIAASGALALSSAEPAIAIAARACTGIGTGLAFVAGSALVRESGGSPFAQGLFGGVGLAGGGFGLAIVPQLEGWLDWRAAYWTSIAVALASLAVLAAAPPQPRRARVERDDGVPRGILRDRRLYRLGVLYAASLGLSLVIGNWVVELLDRNGGVSKEAAGVIGALTLLLGILTRPLGGWLMRAYPQRTRAAVGASLAAGALGTAALVVAEPPWLAVLGGVSLGLAGGIPFAPAFTGAALTRPDAPAAAVGLVNGSASVVALVGTPLLGLTFSLPGDGRIGFAVIAVLWILALALLPSRHDLGVRPASGSRSG